VRRELDLLAERRVALGFDEARAELREDLVRTSFTRGDFALESGVRTSYYFDKYLFVSRPGVLRRLGRFLAELVPRETDMVAAPALGAIAVGTAVSLELGMPLAIVRPGAIRAEVRAVEGGLYGGERVTLIEDVVVTGSRAADAVSKLEGAGATVEAVVCVIDCRRDAAERFTARGISYRPLFTSDEFGL